MKATVTPTRTLETVVSEIVQEFEARGIAQAPGYKAFRFVRTTPGSVIVLRENGNEAVVPRVDIERAIEHVRLDNSVYVDGPSRLREAGVTHVTSPTWALLRLLPLNGLIR